MALARRLLPPIAQRAFWVVQLMVLVVAGLHLIVETTNLKDFLAYLYFVPESLFSIPLIYAALNFGLHGTLATALWAAFLSSPNFLLLEGGQERLGSMLQMGLITTVALLVGYKVDREAAARARAERSEAAFKASEARYRALFATSGMPVLVVDPEGSICDANAAAARLFLGSQGSFAQLHLDDLIGPDAARKVLRSAEEASVYTLEESLSPKPGVQVEVRILSAPFTDFHGQRFIQLVFQDLTGERRRQRTLQTFAAHILQAQEEERRRIARELHDEAIQGLVLLCRHLDDLEAQSNGNKILATGTIQQVRSLAEQIVEDLREFTRRLRPPILDDLGLVACLRRMALELHQRTGIVVDVSVDNLDERLPSSIELALFRIAQEALHNVERHSMASRAYVKLTRSEETIELTIEDNGRGFLIPSGEASFPPDDRHLGLIGMNERAQALGGKLQIRSRLGRGTKVVANVPLATAHTPRVPTDQG